MRIEADTLLNNTVYEYINNTLVKVVLIDNENGLYFIKEDYKGEQEISLFGLYIWSKKDFEDEIINKQEEIKQNNIKQKEEEKKYQEKIQEEKKQEEKALYIENFCNGFTDTMQPMKKANVINALNKVYMYSDKQYRSRKDNTLVYLRNGYLPKIKTKTTYKEEYKNGRYIDAEVKKEFFVLDIGSEYLEITKTEYDYANYLLAYGLENAKLSNEIKKVEKENER